MSWEEQTLLVVEAPGGEPAASPPQSVETASAVSESRYRRPGVERRAQSTR